MKCSRRWAIAGLASGLAITPGCLTESDRKPTLDFLLVENIDTTSGYTIESQVLEDGDVAYETVVELGVASIVDFAGPSSRNGTSSPDSSEGGSIPTQVIIDEGWSREPADYVTRARIDGGEWATVDVTEEARSRYLGVQYVTNDDSIGAAFLQHHDSLADAYHRRGKEGDESQRLTPPRPEIG
ncbi:hypothetical protein [Halovivax limisalsi]|uniref:hypothetical protein n=1 Tax=Halovivax limisalsi TaxID=1453760 RepID=UPI001FFC3321|nr:hypothetical protein [Halovivax limisalsi]